MRFRAVASLVVLTAVSLALGPRLAFSQRGASHSGSAGHSGSSGHGGFAGHVGFARHSGFSGFGRPGAAARGFSQPNIPFRNGSFATRGFRPQGPGIRSAFRSPYPARGLAQNRGPYGYGNRFGGQHRDRGRHGERRRPYISSFGFVYPNLYGYPYYPYPYVIDPDFYDWSYPGDTGEDQGSYSNAPYSDPQGYSAPTPDYGEPSGGSSEGGLAQGRSDGRMSQRQPFTSSSASALQAQQPVTVIFRNGRSPEQIQNYILSSTTLTVLDQGRYQKIPLGQVDVGATEQANRANGLEFQIPRGSGD